MKYLYLSNLVSQVTKRDQLRKTNMKEFHLYMTNNGIRNKSFITRERVFCVLNSLPLVEDPEDKFRRDEDHINMH